MMHHRKQLQQSHGCEWVELKTADHSNISRSFSRDSPSIRYHTMHESISAATASAIARNGSEILERTGTSSSAASKTCLDVANEKGIRSTCYSKENVHIDATFYSFSTCLLFQRSGL